MPHDERQFDQLPPQIVDALRDLDGPAPLPDAQREADLLSGARQHFAETARLSRRQRNLRLFFAGGTGGAIAAAAMIAIVVFIGSPEREQAHRPLQTAAQPSDIDQSGTLDILDAYTLAKQLHQGTPPATSDFNADGNIDQFDIDWLAQQAVTLNHAEQG